MSSNHPSFGNLVGAFGQNTQDKSQTGLCRIRRPGIHGPMVPPEHLSLVPRLLPFTGTAQRAFDGYPDPGATCLFQPAYPGSLNGTITGMLSEFPKMGQSPSSTNDIIMQNLMAPMAIDDITQPMQGTQAQLPPKTETRSDTLVKRPNNSKPYIPIEQNNYKPHYGAPPTEKDIKWEQQKNIPTAETPFSSILNNSMMSGLPGQIMSLAKTFSGMSSSKKQRIQSSVQPEMYNMIEAVMATVTDVGDTELYSLTNRVHPETFENNLVDLLCQCETYSDVIDVVYAMRTDPTLQGKDILGSVEFPNLTAYGEVGVIIDPYGEVSLNVSPEIAQAEAQFSQFISQGVDNYEAVAAFYGNITGNVMTVNVMSYGNIVKGDNYIVEGDDVTDGSYIISFETGRGAEGTYFLSNTSYSASANVPLVLYKVIANPEQQPAGGGGGGGGLGGLIGMIPGQNMFGEASKLISEVLPVLQPQSAMKIQQLLQKVQGQAAKAAGDVTVFNQAIDAWKKYVA